MPCAPYVGQRGTSWGPPKAAVTRPDERGVRAWHVQNAKLRFMLPVHSMSATWSRGAWVCMEGSVHAEFGESTCIGRVLAQLMLPISSTLRTLFTLAPSAAHK